MRDIGEALLYPEAYEALCRETRIRIAMQTGLPLEEVEIVDVECGVVTWQRKEVTPNAQVAEG